MDPNQELATSLSGEQISNVLRSSGPLVKCVLLKCGQSQLDSKTNASKEKIILTDLLEEIKVDTTPKKQMVTQILGGPFTFLGQYEEEGIMLMINRDQDNQDMPINPHMLQPPLDHVEIRGDVLLMRVAETEEEGKEGDAPNVSFLSNEEFFLDYTLEEYVKFASRTDIVAKEPEASEEEGEEEEEESEEEEEDGDDEEYSGESDEEDEEAQISMMNLILAQILKRFREENGRGPSTEELLAMRSALAEKLGIDQSIVNQATGEKENEDVEEHQSKRKAQGGDEESKQKKVKFTNKDEVKIMTDDEGAKENAIAADVVEQDDDDDDNVEDVTPVAVA